MASGRTCTGPTPAVPGIVAVATARRAENLSLEAELRMLPKVEAAFPSFANESMWSGLRTAALSPGLAEAYTSFPRRAAEEACETVRDYVHRTDQRIAEQQRELGRQIKHSAADVSHELYTCQLYAQQAQHIAKVLSDGHEMPQRIVSVQTRIEDFRRRLEDLQAAHGDAAAKSFLPQSVAARGASERE